jgi:3-hydroxy-9,10-secoandrosta-1,3,5(10)-triene-9,17-dione monooxygenase
LIAEAADTLASAYGASAVGAADPMGRVWRDIRAASLHGGRVAPPNLELYGRLRCGQPSKAALV